MQVIVADDLLADYSTQIAKIKGFDHEPIYMKLPHDSGIGYGRNRLVRKAYELGFKHLIMSDDDFMIPNQHFLLTLAHTLIDLNADVLAPSICKINTKESNQLENCARGKIGAVVRSPGMLNEVTILPKVTRLYEDDTHALHPILLTSRPKHGSIGVGNISHKTCAI
jgi:hypothetical protein